MTAVFDPRRYLIPGDQIRSMARALVEGALTDAAKTELGAMVLFDADGNKYCLLPLDGNGNIIANVSMRTGTASALSTLAGSVGELSVATDVDGVFRHTGVAGQASLLDFGSVINVNIPTGTGLTYTHATQLPQHTILHVTEDEEYDWSEVDPPEAAFILDAVLTKKGLRYRIVNRTSRVLTLNSAGASSALNCPSVPPFSDTEFISGISSTDPTNIVFIAQFQVIQAASDSGFAGIGLRVPSFTSNSARLLPGCNVFGNAVAPNSEGQTLIGDSAAAPSENSFAVGFPTMDYNVYRYWMGMKKNLANGATGYLTSDGTDLSATRPYKVPNFDNINGSVWRFDTDIILKQSGTSTNMGCVRFRTFVKVGSTGTPTIAANVVVDETWSGLAGMSAASQIVVSIDATYKGLLFSVTNASGQILRIRAITECFGVTSLV